MSADDDPLTRLEAAMQRIAYAIDRRAATEPAPASEASEEKRSVAAHIDLLIARIDDVLERCTSEEEDR
ncbi:hypothetical protein CGLAMM_11250 [Acetobacteraceae bacterium EV16G]|uniref:Uncharacterized protein n=1 Tax=Sorlinia euscelidii TaxID=3081148 RepID=A0ABU7TYW9_9PROT